MRYRQYLTALSHSVYLMLFCACLLLLIALVMDSSGR